MQEKNCFIDLETTGTDPEIHAIHQLAGIIEIDNKRIEHFDIKVNPGDAKISPEALEIAGVSVHEIREYPPAEEGFRDLKKILDGYINQYDKKDKFNFIGYNANFDDRFLRIFWRDNYYGSYFRWPALDVANLAGVMLIKKRDDPLLLNFKLMTVARYFGIKIAPEKLHDALYDIEITRELFNKIRYQYASIRSPN